MTLPDVAARRRRLLMPIVGECLRVRVIGREGLKIHEGAAGVKRAILALPPGGCQTAAVKTKRLH
jgi:hypothetical protein